MANEATNNLFWEIIKNHNSKNKNLSWGANIYENGKIILSALLTESEYILVSYGKLKAVERLQTKNSYSLCLQTGHRPFVNELAWHWAGVRMS